MNFINYYLLRLAMWVDRKYNHRYPDFCMLIDEFYWKTFW